MKCLYTVIRYCRPREVTTLQQVLKWNRQDLSLEFWRCWQNRLEENPEIMVQFYSFINSGAFVCGFRLPGLKRISTWKMGSLFQVKFLVWQCKTVELKYNKLRVNGHFKPDTLFKNLIRGRVSSFIGDTKAECTLCGRTQWNSTQWFNSVYPVVI